MTSQSHAFDLTGEIQPETPQRIAARRPEDTVSHPLDYFETVYVINLRSRSDRRREMDDELRRIGLALSRPPIQLVEAVKPADAGIFTSIGIRGCFMSHLGILRDARDRGLERVLILEDDVTFTSGFASRIPNVVEALDRTSWAFFYGGHSLQGAVGAPNDAGLAMVPPEVGVQTSHFLAFNGPVVIAACVDFLETLLTRPGGDPRGGPMHVDGAYGTMRRQRPEFATFAAVPELGRQRLSRTDIHPLRWFDKAPVIWRAVAMARRWKNRLNMA